MGKIFGNDYISTDDMGVLYGFGVFTTFLVDGRGEVFLLDRHVRRLFCSAVFFRFDLPIMNDDLDSYIREYICENGIKNKIMRVAITCGNALKAVAPSVVVSCRENTYTREACSKGWRLSVAGSLRNETSPIVRHKTSNYLENFLALKDAVSNGFDDVLFLNTRRSVAETAKCNIFFVRDGRVFTPSEACGLLPGIIRQWVVMQLAEEGIGCVEDSFTLDMLLDSDEVFVTNSVVGIVPVGEIQGRAIGKGIQGEITGFLLCKYRTLVKSD